MIFDTGAWLGYSRPEIVDRFPFIDIVHDYNPYLGEIPAKKYRIPVEIGGLVEEMDIAVNDNVTRYCLDGSGVSFVCGMNNFYDRFLSIDFQNKKVIFR